MGDIPNLTMLERLAGDLSRRKQLRREYQRSFFGVIRFLAPNIQEVVMDRHGQRDRGLRAEANRVIDTRIADLVGPNAVNESYIRLKTKLELETVLYVEYRDSYFSAINLIGDRVFDFILDFHVQRDGVSERDGARIDNMIERIRNAAG